MDCSHTHNNIKGSYRRAFAHSRSIKGKQWHAMLGTFQSKACYRRTYPVGTQSHENLVGPIINIRTTPSYVRLSTIWNVNCSRYFGGLRAIANPSVCLMDGVLTCENLEEFFFAGRTELGSRERSAAPSFAPIVTKSYSADSAGTSICATARKLGRA